MKKTTIVLLCIIVLNHQQKKKTLLTRETYKNKKVNSLFSIVWQIVILFPIKSDDSITIEFDNPSSMSQFMSWKTSSDETKEK